MPTILCIDDNAKALPCRKEMLETKGYQVLTASDGPAGIELARQHSIDAVLLDYDMPGMMGDEVAEVLKREHPKVPIVLLTALGWDIPERVFRIVDSYIQKGEPAAVLLTAIEQVLAVGKNKPIEEVPSNEEQKRG